MANGELIDAREAMNVLGIGENELQTLVARGDLRAFRSAGTMKFRRDDVVGLKSEKGTEPTIIIPAAGQRKPGQSGILASVPAGGAKPSSGISRPAASKPTDATDEIVFDEIELMPADDGLSTQQQTVVGSAVNPGMSDAGTLIEPAVGAQQTGEMTVVESGANERVSTGPADPVSGSGRRQADVRAGSRVGSSLGPAVSRVRQPSVGTARRTASVYQVKHSHPIMTALLVLNAGVVVFTASFFGIMAFKGHVDWDEQEQAGSMERIIPPYIRELGIFESNYHGSLFGTLPGTPQDPRPADEPPSSKSTAQ